MRRDEQEILYRTASMTVQRQLQMKLISEQSNKKRRGKMLNQMKRWTILCLFIALFLSACGRGTATPPASEEEPTATPEAVEKVTIDLWVFEGEEEFLPRLKEVFEEQNPNITLEITEIPEDDYTVKIETALAAGAPPDIGFMFDLTWIKAGHFRSIDDMIESEELDPDDYFQGALTAYCVYEGKTYCLGSYSGGMVLLYSKDMFDAAGLSYPSSTEPMTVDEYSALAEQFANHAENIEERIWGGSADVMLYWSDTRYLFSEDGRTVAVNDEATIHAHQVLADMVINGVAPAPSDYELVSEEGIISEGKLAMYITDNLYGFEAFENAGIRWGVAPLPVEDEGDLPWVSSWTDAWAVFADSAHPDEALKFIAFIATDGNQLRTEIGALPFNLKLADELDWAADSESRQEMLQVMALSREPVFIPDFWGVIDPLWDAWEFIISGEMTAQEAFDEAAPYVQENLDQAWETWESIE